MAQSTLITSPKMRLLQGDAFTASTTDMQGNPMTVKTGPNAGQPTQAFIITCGIAKSDPEAIPYLMKLCNIAATAKPALWPQGVKAPPANFPPQYVQQVAALFGCTHPQYALKIQDGDGFDGNGKPNNVKEGHAGHWIIKFSQPSAIKVYEAGKYSEMERVDIDKAKHSLLKRGYFIRVGAQVSDNENDQRPGLYLNPAMVEIVHAGEEIVSGPSAEEAFGGGTPAGGAPAGGNPPPPPAGGNPPPPPGGDLLVPTATMPAGQTIATMMAAGWTDELLVQHGYATRPAPAVATPPVPPSPATPPAAPVAPTPGASPPAPPVATPSPSNPPPPPYAGFIPDPGGAPQGFKMLPAAQGQTYAALTGAGWTHEQLIQHGMMGPQ